MEENNENLLCNEKCNECPVVSHPNSRMLTHILNLLQDKFGDEVYSIVQENCPNFTVCYDCRIDDFCHMVGCTLKQFGDCADFKLKWWKFWR